MSTWTDRLERYFYEMPLEEDCTEIVQLLALSEDELKVKFEMEKELSKKYATKESIMTNTGNDDPNSESDSEEAFNLHPQKEEEDVESSKKGAKKESTHGRILGKRP